MTGAGICWSDCRDRTVQGSLWEFIDVLLCLDLPCSI